MIGIVTVVVIGAWKMSGSGVKKQAAPKTVRVHKTHKASRPRAYLADRGGERRSYVSVHRTAPARAPALPGHDREGRVEPFRGKCFWLNVSQPENLVITVGGKAVPISGRRRSS